MNLPETLPMGLEIYKDTRTDELIWLVGGTTYDSTGMPFGDSGYQKSHQWWSLDFNSLPTVKRDLYLAWVSRKVWYEPPAGDTVEKGFRFWLYKDERSLWSWDAKVNDLDEHYEVSLTTLEVAQNTSFRTLELVSKAFYRNFYDFFTDDNDLCKTLLLECFADWNNTDTVSEISTWDGHGSEDGWGDDVEHKNTWD